MSVTATAVIASAFVAAESAEAASYKVKSGDSLWTIAQKHDTTVSNLKSINKLSGDIIFPNQVIETKKKSGSSSGSSAGSGSGSGSGSSSSGSSGKQDTYTVKSGDTLSGIAFKYKLSINELMKLNNLDTTLIFPGNVFVVSKGASSGSSGSSAGAGSSGNSGSSSSNSGSSSGSSSTSTVYTVKSGDTLSAIAKRNGVSVANLKKWNNLTSDLILIGQKLNLNKASDSGSSSNNSSSDKNTNEKPSADVNYNVDKLLSAAEKAIGVGYVWGGQTMSGFDCSGFIHFAYNEAGRTAPRLSTDGYYTRSYAVDNPQVGDLVFFKGTYRAGISHMGIYIGNNEFIHAGSTGVTVSNLDNSYWKKHYDGFKRFY